MGYDFKTVTVLVVEDNQPMLELIRGLLLSFGIGRVLIAKDGTEGFREFVKYKPDLVITDWFMHPMDGIAMTKLIRNDPASPNKFVPVVLITAFSERPRIMQARDSGITEILAKPFTVLDFYKRVEAIIERPRKFVKAEDFFGPDRRRKRDNKYDGETRREDDVIKALGYAMPVNWLKYQWFEKPRAPDPKSVGVKVDIDFI